MLLSQVKTTLYRLALEHWQSPELVNRDKAFAEKVDATISMMTTQHLSVDSSVLKNSLFSCAVREMKRLDDVQTPVDIVQILTSCKTTLSSLPSFT